MYGAGALCTIQGRDGSNPANQFSPYTELILLQTRQWKRLNSSGSRGRASSPFAKLSFGIQNNAKRLLYT